MFRRLLLIACVFALCVIMLGAYTRLTDAGLGCPDWPGCYGHMVVADNVAESTKAWTEMIHRYFAGTLGLLIAGLTIASIIKKRAATTLLIFTSLLVIFQAALGMWTVTWKLHPTVVMGHLLGGMLIFALLWCAFLVTRREDKTHVISDTSVHSSLQYLAYAAVALVFFQIALGGWTSANYAAMACTDFPTCRETWWPALHLREAFQLIHPIGTNYEGGVFPHDVRVTIQFMHRLGALCVTSLLLLLVAFSMRVKALRFPAIAMFGLLCIQVGLGISNVLLFLPLPIAVLHNGVGALLLASTITLCFFCSEARRKDV